MPQVTIKAGPRNYLYLRPRSSRCGVLFFRGKRKDSSKIAANVDLDLAIRRRQDDVLDQRAQDVRRLDPLSKTAVVRRA